MDFDQNLEHRPAPSAVPCTPSIHTIPDMFPKNSGSPGILADSRVARATAALIRQISYLSWATRSSLASSLTACGLRASFGEGTRKGLGGCSLSAFLCAAT